MNEMFDNLRQNEYLQMGHEVMAWIERAKEHMEGLLDELPCVFAVVDERGRILRGNRQLAALLGCDPSEVHCQLFSQIFSVSEWERFALNLEACARTGEVVGFELARGSGEGEPQVFAWSVRSLPMPKTGRGWFLIFGQDITHVAWTERKLASVFLSIPVGILRVTEDGTIAEPVSHAAEMFLGNVPLAGRSVFEVLFQPAWSGLSASQRESVGLFLGMLGQAESQYDAVQQHFLTELPYRDNVGQVKWISINYHPLARDGIVRGFLLVLQGRGDEAGMGRRESGGVPDDAQLFAAVRRLDPAVRQAVCLDITVFLEDFAGAVEKGDPFLLLRKVHGLRGALRVANLHALVQLATGIEESLLEASQSSPEEWLRSLRPRLATFSDVCRRCLEMVEFFVFREQGVTGRQSTGGTTALASLEPFFLQAAHSLAKAQNKALTVRFSWADALPLNVAQRALCLEAFSALLQHVVGEEIELPAVREAGGKDRVASLSFMAEIRTDGGLNIILSHDGSQPGEAMVGKSTVSLEDVPAKAPELRFVVDRIAFSGGKVYVVENEPHGARWVLCLPAGSSSLRPER